MENLEEQLKRGREVKMTPDERGMIRFALIREITATKKAKSSFSSVASPYIKNIKVVMHAVRSPFQYQHALKMLAIILIVSVGGGATLSYASEPSLPGEALYSFKVNISEPMRGALALSNESKADFHAQIIVKRVEEAQTLKETGTLTPEKTEIVKKLIEKESETFVEVAVDLQQDGNSEKVEEATSVILETLNDYQEAVSADTTTTTDVPTPTDVVGTENTDVSTMSAMSASVTTDAETRILNTEADTSVDTATEAEVSVLSEGLLDSTMLTLKATLEDTIANPAPEEKPIEPAPVEPVLPTETEQPPVEPVVTPTPVSATTTTDMVSTITNDIVPPIVTEEEKTGTQINTFLRLKK
jgi:hypothetical protein